MVRDRVVEPGGKTGIALARRQLRRIVRERLIIRVAKARRDVGNDHRVKRQGAVLDGLPFGFDFLAEPLGAKLVHQDFDACLVDVVAPAVLVVEPQHRLDVAQQVALGEERSDDLGEKRRAAEPPTDADLETGLAGAIAMEPHGEVMNGKCGAIVLGGAHRDLELARQE